MTDETKVAIGLLIGTIVSAFALGYLIKFILELIL
jgi:hypothetical protein